MPHIRLELRDFLTIPLHEDRQRISASALIEILSEV